MFPTEGFFFFFFPFLPDVASLKKKQVCSFGADWKTSYFKKEITNRETRTGIMAERAEKFQYLGNNNCMSNN